MPPRWGREEEWLRRDRGQPCGDGKPGKEVLRGGWQEQLVHNRTNAKYQYQEQTDEGQRGGSWGMGKKGAGEWETQAATCEMNESQTKRHSIRHIIDDTVMARDGSYSCGEHSIMYKRVEFLCCTPKTNVTLCVSYIQIKNFFSLKLLVGEK